MNLAAASHVEHATANIRKSDVEKNQMSKKDARLYLHNNRSDGLAFSRWWGFLRGHRRGFGLDLLLLLDYGPDLAFQRSKGAIGV
jgi:hypothetical protein